MSCGKVLTDEEERALADPHLGRAFKMAMINDVKTRSEKLAFMIVAEKMLRWLSDGQLIDIESFAGVDMKEPFRPAKFLPADNGDGTFTIPKWMAVELGIKPQQ
jgi:hypothetical protein